MWAEDFPKGGQEKNPLAFCKVREGTGKIRLKEELVDQRKGEEKEKQKGRGEKWETKDKREWRKAS